jgi:hypothetical protein
MLTPRQIAMRSGLPKYMGRPCVHCSNTVRFTANNKCVMCDPIKNKNRLSRVAKSRRNGKAYLAKLNGGHNANDHD